MRATIVSVAFLVLNLGIPSAIDAQIGPDVTVSDSYAPLKYGTVGDISGYSVSCTSCNIGDLEAIWIDDEAAHPLIGLQLYRLENGRMEQIGMSWLKHGYCAVNEDTCGVCQGTPCETLGIGCADTYSTADNANQNLLGPRSEVNAATGVYPYPFTTQNQTGDDIYKRLQAHTADLDPALHPDALYFLEIQYMTTDEQAWGTQYNNSSYRQIEVDELEPDGGWDLDYVVGSDLVAQQPAIHAWQEQDPSVAIEQIFVPDDGLIMVASGATDLGGNLFRYQYTVYNMNSDRSGGSFSVPVPAGVTVSNITFHDVDYHSGEPYDDTDWAATVAGDAITWSTETFAQNPDANALRWSTSYTFGFDANSLPGSADVTIGLFKPGAPTEVSAPAAAPSLPGIFIRADCDGNLQIQLADVITVLGFMFLMDPPPPCLKACDFDDSGNLSLPDAINLLTYLFLMGSEPPPPFPDPGMDPTPDPLPCL